MILEPIKKHAYQELRFLRQVSCIDEDKIPTIQKPEEVIKEQLVYLNPSRTSFNLLDKIISFDDRQQSVYDLLPPLIVIGSAGSGETALALGEMNGMV